ncbi:MFS transporter [Williamsia herbipolensis]|uniref:MFS transporter n=2 Tax=Williamsia herbipolensis TaxID=1603258 RepID=A0AAU4K913_9NOCA
MMRPLDPDGPPYSRRWAGLLVLCLSLLIVVMANTALMVAAPRMTEALNLSSSDLQWVIDGYTVPYAALMLLFGAIGDKFSRRGALWIGLVIFAAGSTYGSLADSTTTVIISRVIMGFGAAVIMPATLSLLVSMFPRSERARAITLWSATSGLAIALGPLIAGALLVHFSWESTFLINLPIVVIAAIAALFVVPPSKAHDAGCPDPVGALLSVIAIASLVYAIIQGAHFGWSALPVSAAVVAVVGLILFVLWELRCSEPMLEVRRFTNRTFSGATLAVFLFFLVTFGVIYYVAQYMQFVLRMSALETGIRLLPLAAAVFVGAFVSARGIKRFGIQATVGAGMALGAIGTLLLVRIGDGSTYLDFLPTLILLGLAIGVAQPPSTDAIMGAFPENRLGVGGGVNDTSLELGGSLGIAILGSILATSYTSTISPTVNAMAKQAAGIPLSPDQAAQAKAVFDAARESVGGASIATDQVRQSIAAMQSTPAAARQVEILTAQARELDAAAAHAFSAAVSHTSIIGGAILAIGTALVTVLLRRSKSDN